MDIWTLQIIENYKIEDIIQFNFVLLSIIQIH